MKRVNLHRRRCLQALAVAPVVWTHVAPAADADVFGPLVQAVTKGAAVREGKVTLDIPPLADNANAVPMTVRVDSPMKPDAYVRDVHVFAEKNPRPVIAVYHFSPENPRAEVSTRIRLNGSQRLLALAVMSDGTFWSGTAQVVATVSACTDDS